MQLYSLGAGLLSGVLSISFVEDRSTLEHPRHRVYSHSLFQFAAFLLFWSLSLLKYVVCEGFDPPHATIQVVVFEV